MTCPQSGPTDSALPSLPSRHPRIATNMPFPNRHHLLLCVCLLWGVMAFGRTIPRKDQATSTMANRMKMEKSIIVQKPNLQQSNRDSKGMFEISSDVEVVVLVAVRSRVYKPAYIIRKALRSLQGIYPNLDIFDLNNIQIIQISARRLKVIIPFL